MGRTRLYRAPDCGGRHPACRAGGRALNGRLTPGKARPSHSGSPAATARTPERYPSPTRQAGCLPPQRAGKGLLWECEALWAAAANRSAGPGGAPAQA